MNAVRGKDSEERAVEREGNLGEIHLREERRKGGECSVLREEG